MLSYFLLLLQVKASVLAAQRDEGPPWNKKPCNNQEVVPETLTRLS